MRSTCDELAKELDELRALVASIAPVNSVLAESQDSLVRQYVRIRRRFDYAAFAVALYASFETFLENLVAAYAGLVTRQVQYADLPPKLVKKHMNRTADLLSRGRLGEGRYAGLRELDVVKNLFECLSGSMPYTLNEVAVVAHDLNLRPSEIDALFAAVGIEQICDRARSADPLLRWYSTSNGLSEAPQGGVPSVTIAQRIDDVVERRNQVAHKGGNPVELLGPDQMSDTMGFIEAFSKSVFAITAARYLEDRYGAPNQAIQLQLREGPYQDGTVVVVDKPAQRLFVGQPVFVIVETSGARWGRIQSLQVDGTAVEAVDHGDVAVNGIGIGLDFRCPAGATVIALEADDDVVWTPYALGAAPTA